MTRRTGKARVLVVDDDQSFRKMLTGELAGEGIAVEETDEGAQVEKLLAEKEFDVILLDLNLPDIGGLEILGKVKGFDAAPEIIVLTGFGTVHTAVEAMKLGAYDFLTKPFKLAELKAIVDKACEKKRLLRENLLLKTQLERETSSQEIVTANILMQDMLDMVQRVAPSDFPVLINGESGVGKELVARRIHRLSERSGGSFLPINCGAIAENMLESELFGHEKGSFTGAHARKLGLLEIANNGTLFLDEIGEMSLQLQGKLLRVLETGSFFRVGGVREINVSVRFLSATNKNVREEMQEGGFRTDLYYRISTMTIQVPPLRERKDDIPLLVEHCKNKLPEFRKISFTRGVMDVFAAYGWPGNVRELQNVVHRALLLAKTDVIDVLDLPADLDQGRPRGARRLQDIEREHILKVFKETGRHRGKTAEILGIDPKTLYRKLMHYGIKD